MPKILSVGCWNIEGIYQKVNGTRISKLEDESVTNTLNFFYIFCLQETHASQNDTPTFDKFVTIPHCRKISANKRYFGGMLLFIRRTLRKGMKVNRDIDEDCVEVILDKDFFGLTECVRILFTYASPLTSPYTKSRSRTVLEKIDTHIDNGRTSCLVTGDLNGRTKTDEDFIRDSDDKHSPITDIPLYIRDSQLKRNNRDTHTIDEQGKMILEICKSNSLRILNGRTMGTKLVHLRDILNADLKIPVLLIIPYVVKHCCHRFFFLFFHIPSSLIIVAFLLLLKLIVHWKGGKYHGG